MKSMKKWRKISIKQVCLIIITFIAMVAIAFVLIRLANFLISDILELHGWLKTFSQFIAIILVIYPAKITFGSVLYHVNEDLSRKLAEET